MYLNDPRRLTFPTRFPIATDFAYGNTFFSCIENKCSDFNYIEITEEQYIKTKQIVTRRFIEALKQNIAPSSIILPAPYAITLLFPKALSDIPVYYTAYGIVQVSEEECLTIISRFERDGLNWRGLDV